MSIAWTGGRTEIRHGLKEHPNENFCRHSVGLVSGRLVCSWRGARPGRRAGPQSEADLRLRDAESRFSPDPFSKKLEAGGPIKTKRGAVTTHVSKAPDFRLNYTAGDFPLRIFVESKGDTTLLVNLPDNTWYANDDGGPGKNPQITFAKPKSGRYDIWVGTVGPKNVDAILKISEHGATVAATKKAKTITLIDVRWDEYSSLKKREMRVYDLGNNSLVYKTSRGDSVWRINVGAWAVPSRQLDIQFWEINSGIGQRDRKIGSTQVGTCSLPGFHSVDINRPTTKETRNETAYKYTVKYRIDN